MSIRMRRPETTRLELSQGDFLIVKQDLTAGEYRAFLRASTKPVHVSQGQTTATMELDPMASGVALVRAYLLDWSFTDPDGKPITIADQPPEVVSAALDQIDHDAYMEVQNAIQAHQKARTAELENQKKTTSGPSLLGRTSTSAA